MTLNTASTPSGEFSLDFPCAYGAPEASGQFRTEPEDFQVDEVLGFEPSGSGEHGLLHLRKRGENTAWLAEQIAALAGVAPMDVGYCGRKDRHARTSQWFSVYLPKGPVPDWHELNSDSVELLQVARHHQKLRRGQHQANRFQIRLRAVQCPDLAALEQRLQRVLAEGVPNYFGEQRFGRNGNNLRQAEALLVAGRRLRNRQERGLILSAARSWLFNQVLAERVRQGNWRTPLSGEPETRASGPLWGRGRLAASAATLALEQQVLAQWQPWCEGLEHVGLSQERRPLVLSLGEPSWRWESRADASDLVLAFSLAAGEFATAVLRELLCLQTAGSPTPAEAGE